MAVWRLPITCGKAVGRFLRDLCFLIPGCELLYKRKYIWPSTVDKAVEQLKSELAVEELAEYSSYEEFLKWESREHGMEKGDLALHVRDMLALAQGNDALLADCKTEDPDDAAEVVLREFWKGLTPS